ncbi:MAG: MIP/aquaporin family protein [Vicinamibacterales bacterium]
MPDGATVLARLRAHWPEYVIEATGLGLFMLSASLFGAALEHPASLFRAAWPAPMARRFFMGLAMAGTAALIIYSPFGKRSGAHMNPAVTLTFWWLGRVHPGDAAWYMLAQVVGGVAGVGLAVLFLGGILADPHVNYVVTRPGVAGPWLALVAEVAIAFLLMGTVLVIASRPHLNRFTGLAVAVLLTVYITFEAPLSGMSLNPARSLASAVAARAWTALWIYFVAPVTGMIAAAAVYGRWPGAHQVLCAKLHHDNHQRCIFRCGYPTAGRHVTHA